MLTNLAGANTPSVLVGKVTMTSGVTDSAEAPKVDSKHHSLESRPGVSIFTAVSFCIPKHLDQQKYTKAELGRIY